jgi:hypothetical protein
MRDGASLAESEEFIDRRANSEEDSAVLWLRAWAERSGVGLLRGWSSGHTRGDG